MVRLVVLFLCVIPATAVLGQDFRWKFTEEFKDRQPNENWKVGGIRGLDRRIAGETTFSSAYETEDAKKFVDTDDGIAIRSLLPKTQAVGATTYLQLLRWGFKNWGGNDTESSLVVQFQVKLSDNFEFPEEQQLLELFYDTAFIKHDYDGPHLLLALNGNDKVRLHYYVVEENLKTGVKISSEKFGKLPGPLAKGEWHTFRVETKLCTPPKPKDPKAVRLEEIPTDGSLRLFVDGKEVVEVRSEKFANRANNREFCAVNVGGPVTITKKREVTCHADIRGIIIGSPK